jgi:alpha-galactosidase
MDPDFLETLFPVTMPYNVSKVEMSFWSMWSAPLLVATDVRQMSPAKRHILLNAEVIAVDQDPLFTAGDQLFEEASDHTQAWAKPLHDGSAAVILFNPNAPTSSPTSRNVTVHWSQLGWPSDAVVTVRDLWAHQDLGNYRQSFTHSVAGHDVFMFRAIQQ